MDLAMNLIFSWETYATVFEKARQTNLTLRQGKSARRFSFSYGREEKKKK